MSELLFVVTNSPDIVVPEAARVPVFGEGSTQTTVPGGPHLVEMGSPYYDLSDPNVGHNVVIVSPDGGPVKPYIKAGDPSHAKYQRLLEADPELQEKLANTRRADTIDPEEFEAVLFIGGFGAAFGVPQSIALQGITRAMYESGRPVAAICHGPAGLMNVDLSNGEPLVKDRMMTALTNREEWRGNKAEILIALGMPLMEDRLRQRGADFKTGKPWRQSFVVDRNVVDGVTRTLITGPNPQSIEAVTRELVGVLR